MFSDKFIACDLREHLQKAPASYISQVLLQMDEQFSFCKPITIRPIFRCYLAMFDLFNQTTMRVHEISVHPYVCKTVNFIYLQSTLVISNSKGLSEILRDIRTSTYQICRIEGKKFEQPHLTNICVIGLL